MALPSPKSYEGTRLLSLLEQHYNPRPANGQNNLTRESLPEQPLPSGNCGAVFDDIGLTFSAVFLSKERADVVLLGRKYLPQNTCLSSQWS